ncbi:ShlB/FhaC/HecB family hemolysin secretion/activation protein [filamentous cyanobacterium CCT1]|nr:ShlB/FhaC/HecB family hemolysin secretion/activation protein [filamentous cyanobacterium CCT1]PSN79968.1 ShlB/FhaC/HecB family hemolysin secretion/activation protein [filamentous cyanobacterium CCP4]
MAEGGIALEDGPISFPQTIPVTIAQTVPPDSADLFPDVPDPLEQTIPAPPDFPVPRPAPDLELEFPDPPPPPEGAVPSDFRVRVERVEVLGSTVLQAEIAALTSAIEGQDATLADLLRLRADITQLYVTNGYITSGAFLPTNQNLTDGVVQIQVIEGQLEALEISGLTRLREGYVRSRVSLGTGAPLNQQRLESALQLLQLDPLLSTVNAELTAGRAPGQNILLLDLDEAPAFLTSLSVDNYRPPSIGSLQGSAQVVHNNLLGFGDRLSAAYSLGQGLNLYDFSYDFPITPQGGTVSLGFNNSDSRIVEDVFRDLGIRSEAQTLSLGVRQPLIRTPQSEFALGLTLDLRRSQSFILEDIPFSFSLGPEAGRSRVAALRFSQDWVQRYPRRVLAARSQFSFGLDAFDATVNDIGIDGRFFSWLGQAQWVEQLSPTVLLISRINTQLTPDALLPLERFSLGGISTVRGYEENQVVADNGLTVGVEALISLSNPPNQLQLNPFLELGTGWNNQGTNPDPSTLASVGVGLRWLITPGLRFRGDYGIPLIDANSQSSSLQSSGFYFSLTFEPTTLLRSAD